MKKKAVKKLKKLKLSLETLRDLTSSEAHGVVGGSDPGGSCQTLRICCQQHSVCECTTSC